MRVSEMQTAGPFILIDFFSVCVSPNCELFVGSDTLYPTLRRFRKSIWRYPTSPLKSNYLNLNLVYLGSHLRIWGNYIALEYIKIVNTDLLYWVFSINWATVLYLKYNRIAWISPNNWPFDRKRRWVKHRFINKIFSTFVQ